MDEVGIRKIVKPCKQVTWLDDGFCCPEAIKSSGILLDIILLVQIHQTISIILIHCSARRLGRVPLMSDFLD